MMTVLVGGSVFFNKFRSIEPPSCILSPEKKEAHIFSKHRPPATCILGNDYMFMAAWNPSWTACSAFLASTASPIGMTHNPLSRSLLTNSEL